LEQNLYQIGIPSQIYIGSTILSLILVILLWTKRKITGARSLMWLFFALSFWAFGVIFESSSTTVELKLFWSQVAYIGTVYTPFLFFIFTTEYSSRKLVKKGYQWILLAFIPTATLFLSWTNNIHGLIWPEIRILESNNLAVYEHGIAFWVFLVYTYVMIIWGWYQLLISALKYHKLYKSQAQIILLASIVAVIGNLLYLSPRNPIPGIEWTLIGFIASGILISLNIISFKLFNLVPTARAKLVDIMQEGVILVDDLGRIKDVNPSFLRLTTLDISKNYIGLSINKTLNHIPELLNAITAPNPDKENTKAEIKYADKYLELHIQELRNKVVSGNSRLIVINNISSLKNAEIDLNRTNTRLNQEIKAKEKLIEELNAYAHTVAHDLKTPLNVLAGYSELISDGLHTYSEEEILKYSNEINTAAFKLVHIVDELLLLSSVRSLEVQKEILDMKPVFEGALLRCEKEIKDYEAIIHKPKNWIHVCGYASWIEEVWVNLITNALKYGGEKPEVYISCEKKKESVVYTVCDNGNGIPEELIGKLFIAYSRLYPTKAPGQGLGLSIVKRILDKLGGSVEVLKRQGHGACFAFELPDKDKRL